MRATGTTARGIRAPFIKTGDNIARIAAESILNAAKEENFSFNDRDVVGITEAIVARAQGNYADCSQIAEDIRTKFTGAGNRDSELLAHAACTLAITFPILSRNRFGNILKGIAQGCDKLYIMLSYPSDEVGNELIPWEALDEAGINPYTDVLDEKKYREIFGYETRHRFTGIDYVEYYKSFGEHVEIVFANDVRSVLKFTKNVLCCDIHTRARSKRLLKEADADIVFGLDEILAHSVNGSGYNERYGLLGSNMATENSIKLFPRDCQAIVDEVSGILKEATGKKIEVMIYGDGAFKDSVGKIWELADPVVSPAYTSGLEGRPNELKLKYMLDNALAGKSDSEKMEEVKKAIRHKDDDLGNGALGTTPRLYVDLLGSLCDLVSGSGDKGTPIVLVQGYFDNITV